MTLPMMKKASVISIRPGAAARGVERAGAAAVGQLHADAEHEGADDQRVAERRDRAAKTRQERRHRHDDRRRDRDQQQGRRATRRPARAQ